MIPPFALTFVEGLLGPSFAKFAKPIIYALAIAALLAAFDVAKCSYDRSVIAKHETQIAQRAAPATDQATKERTADAVHESTDEQEAHNVIAAQPDQPIAPSSRALACKQLHDAGRHPAACR